MHADDPLGSIELDVLDAVHRGLLRARRTARKIPRLNDQPAGEAILHEVLHRCERAGLLHGRRDASGRRYELTAAGHSRLRADRQFRAALARLLLRT
jgi:DNA-binding PadR family transcriptional regulator